jgi:hypothetical protein
MRLFRYKNNETQHSDDSTNSIGKVDQLTNSINRLHTGSLIANPSQGATGAPIAPSNPAQQSRLPGTLLLITEYNTNFLVRCRGGRSIFNFTEDSNGDDERLARVSKAGYLYFITLF